MDQCGLSQLSKGESFSCYCENCWPVGGSSYTH